MARALRLPGDPDALEVRITPMRRRHLRGVLRIEQQVYPRPWTFGLFLGEISQRATRVYLVARVGTEVVGYAGMFRAVDDGHITTIAVDPAWQRHGIATRMLLALARAAVERGCRNLTLEVRMSNSGAQALYQRFGFVPAGVRKGYYPETGEDALVMWANDVDTELYAARLREIESGVPGRTVVEGDWIVRPSTRPRRFAPRLARGRRDPGHRDLVRRDRRGGGRARRHACALVGRGQPDRPPRPLRRRRPRDRQPGPRRAAHPGRGPGAGRVRRGRPRDRGRRRHRRARAWWARCSWASAPPRPSPSCGTSPSWPSTTSRATSTPRSSRSPTSSCRWSCCWCRAATPCWSTWRTTVGTACSARPSTTPPARRSTRWPGSWAWAIPGARSSTASPSTGDPHAIAFPRAMLDRDYDFSFSGLKTAVVNHVRKHPDVSTPDVARQLPGGGGRRARHQGPPGGP